MLFTADLRAFAERLLVKSEVKEETEIKTEVIKTEEGEEVATEIAEKTTTVLKKGIKREAEEDEKSLTEIKETIVKKTKRRRKA